MTPEMLKKHVEKQWDLYSPEAIVANLMISTGGVKVENDYSYLNNFAKRHNLILSKEELEVKYNTAQGLVEKAKENNGFSGSSMWIKRIIELKIDIHAEDFDIKEHISKYKYDREFFRALPVPIRLFREEFLMEWNEKQKFNSMTLQYQLPDNSKISFSLYYDIKDGEKVFKQVDIVKIDKDNEVMDYDKSAIFFTQVMYNQQKNANNLTVKSFTKDFNFEKMCRIDLVGDKNAMTSSQFDYANDYLVEFKSTSENNSVTYNAKEFDKRYKNGKLYDISNKKTTDNYSQALQFSNEKDLILSFQVLANNGIPTPIKINKTEDGSFVVSYILTTKTIVNWNFTVNDKSIDLAIKEKFISPKEKAYGKELETKYTMSRHPDEFELEALSIGNQLFYQDLKTTEEVLNKLPKLMEFYNKVESEYNGKLESITHHMEEAEELFSSFKYMSYSRRLKQEKESAKPKI